MKLSEMAQRNVGGSHSVQDRLRSAQREIVPPGLTIRAMLSLRDREAVASAALDGETHEYRPTVTQVAVPDRVLRERV